MATYLTAEEYQLYCPANLTDYNSTQFEALVRSAMDVLLQNLPRSMQPFIKALNFTDKPELKAYWLDSLKPWLAWCLHADIIQQAGKNVTTEGVRNFNSSQSTESNDIAKGELTTWVGQKRVFYQQRAMSEYQHRDYVFDGVAYQPTNNMSIWEPIWFGMTYQYNTALGLWGWFNGTAWVGRPINNAVNNRVSGITLI